MRRSEILIKANRKAIPLDNYAGEWVAFANGKVVAHQDTPKKLMKKVGKLKGSFRCFWCLRKTRDPTFDEAQILLPEKGRPYLSTNRCGAAWSFVMIAVFLCWICIKYYLILSNQPEAGGGKGTYRQEDHEYLAG